MPEVAVSYERNSASSVSSTSLLAKMWSEVIANLRLCLCYFGQP